jgi:hypothetical protein
MAENKPQDLERPAAGHEVRDVNTWAVTKFAIALVLLCGVALLILAGLFKYFLAREVAEETAPGATAIANRLPPAPRLQTNPIHDLEAMRAGEDAVLNSYGWVDQKNGIARIPISRAIDLLAQHGLPSRPQGPAASGVTVPTESGLGEMMQRPGGPLGGAAAGK